MGTNFLSHVMLSTHWFNFERNLITPKALSREANKFQKNTYQYPQKLSVEPRATGLKRILKSIMANLALVVECDLQL